MISLKRQMLKDRFSKLSVAYSSVTVRARTVVDVAVAVADNDVDDDDR